MYGSLLFPEFQDDVLKLKLAGSETPVHHLPKRPLLPSTG